MSWACRLAPIPANLFLRLSRRVRPGLTLALQGRDRRRVNDSFPAPNSRDYAASVEFSPDHHNSIAVTYHDYSQDAFPIPSSVLSPGDGFTPANAEGNYGQTERIKQLRFRLPVLLLDPPPNPNRRGRVYPCPPFSCSLRLFLFVRYKRSSFSC